MAELPGKGAPEDPETARVVAEAGAEAAWRFASAAHAGQLRSANLTPAIHHPERVAELVAANGGDPEMVAAALLHDVIEDSAAEAEQIERAFGPGVAGLVATLSDDRSVTDYEARKDALREQVREGGERATLIYAADKLANCVDLRQAYGDVGEEVAERLGIPLELRIRIWRDDAEMCEQILGETGLVRALGAELDALESDRSGASEAA